MKCVQKYDSFGKGAVIRLSDERARKLVASKLWDYVPKSIWKAISRDGNGVCTDCGSANIQYRAMPNTDCWVLCKDCHGSGPITIIPKED